ncbi:hypothetical protein LYNGBM3L_56860 [Moorena producens 3L]|uniref:Uncharacterized protein n=1 Tax=Moorena producens 3L TaxID=489825 RepID=F4XR77_9CYAN|nr:hypothetical protein LYNGBM3L_56860 [Moorena producens 3L]
MKDDVTQTGGPILPQRNKDGATKEKADCQGRLSRQMLAAFVETDKARGVGDATSPNKP